MTAPICPYCNRKSVLRDSKIVYGRSYGYIWICFPCMAYVGCHKGTRDALGIPANKELREARNRAHKAFDPLWRLGGMGRKEAYKFLADRMGLGKDETHIGMFNLEQCKQVILICSEFTKVLE